MRIRVPAMTRLVNSDTGEFEQWTAQLEVTADEVAEDTEVLTFTYSGFEYTVFKSQVENLEHE